MKQSHVVQAVSLFTLLFALLGSVMLMVPSVSSDAGSTVETDAEGTQHATIIMDSYSYSPHELIVQAGKPVAFTLKNVATFIPHTFVVDDPDSGLHLHVEVGAGDTQTIRFTPNQRGTFPFYCDKKLLFFKSHRDRGQEGRLDVR